MNSPAEPPKDDDDDMDVDWGDALAEQAADEASADEGGGGDDAMATDWEAALGEQKEGGGETTAAPAAADAGKPLLGEMAVFEIPVEVTAVLGTAMMPISQILKLGRGAVVELDRMIGEDIELHANNRLVARGEVVVVEDRLGVTMTEIIKTRS